MNEYDIVEAGTFNLLDRDVIPTPYLLSESSPDNPLWAYRDSVSRGRTIWKVRVPIFAEPPQGTRQYRVFVRVRGA